MDDQDTRFPRHHSLLHKTVEDFPGGDDGQPVEIEVRLDGEISGVEASGVIRMNVVTRAFDDETAADKFFF